MQAIDDLQSEWCSLTGQEINRRALERMFYAFLNAGFTGNDLRCVVRHLQLQNKQMTGAAFAFRVHKIVGDLEWFASMLAEAKAVLRNRRPAKTAKEQVLQQWKPEVGEAPAKDNVIPIKDAFKRIANGL